MSRIIYPIYVYELPKSSSVFVLINGPTTLTEGGLFFTDTLTETLVIEFSGLGLGSYIRWLNLATKPVILSGFTTVNGTGISTGKGLNIAAGATLEGFVNVAGNFKTLSGAYTQSFLPGFAPPSSIYWRVDFNWILSEIQFYYDDNPTVVITLNGSNIVSFQRSEAYSTASLNYNVGSLNNGLQDGYVGRDNPTGSQAYIVTLPIEKKVNAIHVMPQSGNYNLPTQISLYRGESLTDWFLVKTWTGSPLPLTTGGIKLEV